MGPSHARAATTGTLLALAMGAMFGTSGSFASALLGSGWSAGAAVTTRISVAALALLVPALIELRAHRHRLLALTRRERWRAGGQVTLFGLLPVALSQLGFYSAIQTLDVGVALLLQYLGIVLVVVWLWLRHGQVPRLLTACGALLSLVGVVLVLDLRGSAGLDLVGVAWALSAAVGLAVFYLLPAKQPKGELLPPVTLAWAGMVVGAAALWSVAAIGALPLRAELGDVELGGLAVSWLVPVLGMSILAAALPYIAGIVAARRLGARLASFLGLTEVLFAGLFAWLLLDQLPTGLQLVGGAVVLVGLVIIRSEELRGPRSSRTQGSNQPRPQLARAA